MSWSIEEYLICVLDHFEDYTGVFLVLGYDLRIDAYIDYRLTGVTDRELLRSGTLLKITRKSKREMTESAEVLIEFDLEKVSEKELNPIEAAHWQKFNFSHKVKVLEQGAADPQPPLQLCLGKVMKIDRYNSPIYEKSFELRVNSPQIPQEEVILLTQDDQYVVGDQVCFLVKKKDGHSQVLGLKARGDVSPYLNSRYFENKNSEINLVQMS